MSDDPDFLFVYGTLRPSSAGEGAFLVRHLASAGPATVRGLLYDLGRYPGMIRGEGDVHGELLRISSAAELETLDCYEECGGSRPLFRRERIEARRADGKIVHAWAYLYARSVRAATLIEGGDYLRWPNRPPT